MDMIARLKTSSTKTSNPLKAIKAFCADCIGTVHTRAGCTHSSCVLFDYRDGMNPRRKKKALTEQQRHRMAANMKRMRARLAA